MPGSRMGFHETFNLAWYQSSPTRAIVAILLSPRASDGAETSPVSARPPNAAPTANDRHERFIAHLRDLHHVNALAVPSAPSPRRRPSRACPTSRDVRCQVVDTLRPAEDAGVTRIGRTVVVSPWEPGCRCKRGCGRKAP